MTKEKQVKTRVLGALKNMHPQDRSIEEIAKASGINRETTSKYIAVLVAEGKIELSRTVGRAKMYRLKR